MRSERNRYDAEGTDARGNVFQPRQQDDKGLSRYVNSVVQGGRPAPLALDILLFLANNPEHNTAKDICRMRGHKPGIVSVHVERLVNDGLLERQEMPGDRRQTRLICTEQAQALIERGRQVQWQFGRRLLEGIPEEDLATMRRCLERMDGNLNGICKEKR